MRLKPRTNAWNMETMAAVWKMFQPLPFFKLSEADGTLHTNCLVLFSLVFLELKRGKRLHHNKVQSTALKLLQKVRRRWTHLEVAFEPGFYRSKFRTHDA